MAFKRNRLKYVNSRIWETTDTAIFPEQESGPDSMGEKAQIGVCFSGGGTRSATCTHGQLKALDELGLIDKIGYISCVSGGAWAVVPYTYLDDHWDDSHFFGPVIEPEKLSLDALNAVNERNYLYTVTHAGIADEMLKQWAKLATDETFSRVIGDVFLDRFGLNSKKKFFAYTENHLNDILTRNKNMTADDFYTVRKGRPFTIASGAILRPGAKDYLFEMTPWYTGVHKFYEKGGSRNRDVGGGYIESFAVDSDSPDSVDEQVANVRLGSRRHRFTLSDVIGTTGAAPSEVLNNIGLKFVGFPEFKHWPVKDAVNAKAKEYEIGDGGNIENLGILPLLKRGVERIVVFVNTRAPLSLNNTDKINKSVTELFEKNHVNQVFDPISLLRLKTGLLERLREGKATIHSDNYTIVKNEHHGISGGNQVKILWVYNQNYKNWEERLPSEVSNKIGIGKKLSNFPHFATFEENFPKVIDLHPVQANLLSHMSCSVVMDNADMFSEIIDNA